MYYTIDPDVYSEAVGNTQPDGFWLHKHDVYPQSSVLAGQASRSKLQHFDTVEAAQTYCKENDIAPVQVNEQPGLPIEWIRAEVPQHPPAWFDPGYAGERWDDEY